MEQETIQLPPVVTGIALSANIIALIAECIDECPLSRNKRDAITAEWNPAIITAAKAMQEQPPTRLAAVNSDTDS